MGSRYQLFEMIKMTREQKSVALFDFRGWREKVFYSLIVVGFVWFSTSLRIEEMWSR